MSRTVDRKFVSKENIGPPDNDPTHRSRVHWKDENEISQKDCISECNIDRKSTSTERTIRYMSYVVNDTMSRTKFSSITSYVVVYKF